MAGACCGLRAILHDGVAGPREGRPFSAPG